MISFFTYIAEKANGNSKPHPSHMEHMNKELEREYYRQRGQSPVGDQSQHRPAYEVDDEKKTLTRIHPKRTKEFEMEHNKPYHMPDGTKVYPTDHEPMDDVPAWAKGYKIK